MRVYHTYAYEIFVAAAGTHIWNYSPTFKPKNTYMTASGKALQLEGNKFATQSRLNYIAYQL